MTFSTVTVWPIFLLVMLEMTALAAVPEAIQWTVVWELMIFVLTT